MEINNYSSGSSKKYISLKQNSIKKNLFNKFYRECCFKNCSKAVYDTYNLRLQHRKIQQIFPIFLLGKYIKKIFSFKAMESAFGYKQIPLCKIHNIALYKNQLVLDHFKCKLIPTKL
jgi:hypothetical protein